MSTESIYTHERKKKLAEKLSKIKNKNDMNLVLEILRKANPNVSGNDNGIFLFFHKFDDATYASLEAVLKNSNKNSIKNTSDTNTEGQYISYAPNEFPDETQLESKLKYSNREKNIIKRQRYDDNTSDNTDI